MVKRISTGSPFEAKIGYSRAVVDRDMIYVSGTTGYDYSTMQMPVDAGVQARNALTTIGKALAAAGSSLSAVVRVRYYPVDMSVYDAVVAPAAEPCGEVRPAATWADDRARLPRTSPARSPESRGAYRLASRAPSSAMAEKASFRSSTSSPISSSARTTRFRPSIRTPPETRAMDQTVTRTGLATQVNAKSNVNLAVVEALASPPRKSPSGSVITTLAVKCGSATEATALP